MTLPRWIGIITGLLLVLGGAPVAAQSSADIFFHEAAQRYVGGDLEAARQAVDRGLDVAPSDPRLLALREKLRQQEERQDGDRSSQGDSQKDEEQRSKGGDVQVSPSESSGQDSRGDLDDSSDPQSSQGPDGGASAQVGEDERQPPQRTRNADDRLTNALSRTQAARLLQALENQETKLLREVRGQASKNETVEKDW